jgi:hypothetical protein
MESKNKKLTPAELVKIHLKDPSHVITDEELQMVKVGADGDDKPGLENAINLKKEELNLESKKRFLTLMIF